MKNTAQTTEKTPANRKYKDTVFRMLFKNKNELLSLFNAVNGTNYTEPEELEITTLENAIYMSRKNDISCVLDMQLDLYEHQSTVNPNIALRDLFYIARLFEKHTGGMDLYSGRRIKLPVPKFIVFYNGTAKQPERRTFRLSDSYAKNSGEINLELTVLQININPGNNEKLVGSCRTLFEYIQFTDMIRQHIREMPIDEAVSLTVDECIEKGILSEFLRKNREEVVPLSIFEYDEKKHMETMRREGYEDGMAEGYKHGKSEGYKTGKSEGYKSGKSEGYKSGKSSLIRKMLKNKQKAEAISEMTEEPIEYILDVERQMLMELREDSEYKAKLK